MLDGTFPEVFACLFVVQTKHKSVVLRLAVVVVFDYQQGEFLLFEVELTDFRPEEQSDLLSTFEDENAGWCEPQMVFAAVFALN